MSASQATSAILRPQPPRRRATFTLIEMLVVVAIISLLASLLLPALQSARYRAKLTACISNQKQQGLAITSYADDFDGALPISDPHSGWGPFATTSGYTVKTWTDGTTTFPADGSPDRHVYRGLGAIWANRYMSREMLLDPDWRNETESDNISYQDKVDWSKFKTPGPSAPGWSHGTYVFYSWSFRPGIAGSGVNGTRLLGRKKEKTTGLVQCRMGGTNLPTMGTHGRQNMNMLFEDGHVATIGGIQTYLAWRAGSGLWYAAESNASDLGSGYSHWWVWAEDHAN